MGEQEPDPDHGDNGTQGAGIAGESTATVKSSETNGLELSAPDGASDSAASGIASDATEDRSLPTSPSQTRVRDSSTRVLLMLAVAYTLYFAKAVLFPVVLALILAALMSPVVRWLHRRRMPESLAAILLIVGSLTVLGFGIARLTAPAQIWFEHPRDKIEKISHRLRSFRNPMRELETVADSVEDATAGSRAANDEPIKVVVEQPSLITSLLSSTGQVLAGFALTIALLYFLLVDGTTFLRRFVSVVPGWRGKRDAVELVRGIEKGVSSYLLTVTLINVCLGVAVGTAMAMLQMPTPVLWGGVATLCNFVPYLGAVAGATIVFFVAILSFDSLAYALLAPVCYMTLSAIEGNFITPRLLGRSMSMNPIFVFLSLTFWGWIWGVGGAILAVPLLGVAKVVCDQFEGLHTVSVLLSGDHDMTAD